MKKIKNGIRFLALIAGLATLFLANEANAQLTATASLGKPDPTYHLVHIGFFTFPASVPADSTHATSYTNNTGNAQNVDISTTYSLYHGSSNGNAGPYRQASIHLRGEDDVDLAAGQKWEETDTISISALLFTIGSYFTKAQSNIVVGADSHTDTATRDWSVVN